MIRRKSAHEVLHDWIYSSGHCQSDIATMLNVSRTAVSKWCSGDVSPSPKRARLIEELSGGAVPADSWPHRVVAQAPTVGARALQEAIYQRGASVLGLSREIGLPQRSLARWAAGQFSPRAHSIRAMNKALGLRLSVADFETRA